MSPSVIRRASAVVLLVVAALVLLAATPAYARGGSGGGSGHASTFSGRSSTTRTSTTRTTTTRTSRTTPRPAVTNRTTVVVHNHVYAPRVYGGHTYVYRSGGWGYGYYGVHPVFGAWYGYPLYYGWPGHWSGWDFAWGIPALLVPVLLLALLGAAVAL